MDINIPHQSLSDSFGFSCFHTCSYLVWFLFYLDVGFSLFTFNNVGMAPRVVIDITSGSYANDERHVQRRV
jgi:hypothetical protein